MYQRVPIPLAKRGALVLGTIAVLVPAITQQFLLRFDLNAIPATATVTSAKLTIAAYQPTFGASATLRAHQILAPWTESAVTWSLPGVQ
jgi:hypothetical protein